MKNAMVLLGRLKRAHARSPVIDLDAPEVARIGDAPVAAGFQLPRKG